MRIGETHVTELHHPNLSQLTDTAVGRLRLQEELRQRHLLTPEEFPHLRGGFAGAPARPPGRNHLEEITPMTFTVKLFAIHSSQDLFPSVLTFF